MRSSRTVDVFVQDAGQLLDHLVGVGRVLLGPDHGEAGAVGDQQPARAVEDIAPRRQNPQFPPPVVLGPFFEFVTLVDLEKPEAQDQENDQDQDEAGHHLQASLEQK